MSEKSTAPPITSNLSNNGTNPTLEDQVIAYSALYSMALLCIFWGSLRSLKFVQNHISKKELLETSITTKEAKKFPITASFVLFSLYVVFKINVEGIEYFTAKAYPYLSQSSIELTESVIVNVKSLTGNLLNSTKTNLKNETFLTANQSVFHKIVNNYPFLNKGVSYLPEFNKANLVFFFLLLLCWEGCLALSIILKPIFSFILMLLPIGDNWPRRNVLYLFSLKRSLKDAKEMKETQLDKASKKETEYLIYGEYDTHLAIAFFFCSFVGISYLYKRHWITNNLLGLAFSIYGIENLHLASFKAGTILLCGLFIYDIFWVFATDVMTTVAKGIDAPILLIFPQDLIKNGWLEASKHGMLGLGDIVIPGIFVALLYRFDHYLGSPKRGSKDTNRIKNRYYFYITLFAYAVGLCITMSVMHHFKAAQPALLYLVPTCLFVPLFVALLRGELKALWNYSEEQFVEKNEKSNKLVKEKKN